MIAVIADDFTGAAEIGGVGLRYGLKVAIETKVCNENDIDLLIVVADTRNMNPESAVKEIEEITELLMLNKPEYIYKKIDSVFRGNVGEEIEAQMKVSCKNKCIIIAGNPSLDRYIKEGTYYIENVPLAETHFSMDSDYKIKSSSVVDFVQVAEQHVYSKNLNESMPDKGILIGDVTSLEDLEQWKDLIDEDTIAAGGAGFFDALLSRDYNHKYNVEFEHQLSGVTLFIFGSAFPKNEDFIEKVNKGGFYISNMPETLYWGRTCNYSQIKLWSDEIIRELAFGKKVILTINHSGNKEKELPSMLKDRVGKVVYEVAQKVALQDILIEGGATASVIFKYLNITRLFPFKEIEPGVIQMKAHEYTNLYITTKPGSYNWPEQMLTNKIYKKES